MITLAAFSRSDSIPLASLTAKAPGVVSGLSIKPAGTNEPQDGLVISPGTAIDPYGRETGSSKPDWWRMSVMIRR